LFSRGMRAGLFTGWRTGPEKWLSISRFSLKLLTAVIW